MRGELLARHAHEVDNGEWRRYQKRTIPSEQDAGLLYQDPPGTQEAVNALGPEYARKMTYSSEETGWLLNPKEN